jgi:hypothetical protein
LLRIEETLGDLARYPGKTFKYYRKKVTPASFKKGARIPQFFLLIQGALTEGNFMEFNGIFLKLVVQYAKRPGCPLGTFLAL